ncbi:Crp/Fnr family transcriptional regulator [Actinokineospora sp. PR83]|uniref:Crp/Fnr family transcriptional regulator n=1 Tax=Actinokineospora sp. PR83 TaxID=2884908 RepID=UPI0027E190CE|nr:Crp/Fnr family transcriptional regulator [Actinokineospora sp. PR83]MCG8916275.1 Crp/Fnr family transcriptional regulator [Actinokineospora sp. PR83]
MDAIPPAAAVTRDHRIGSFWRRLTDAERVALIGVGRRRSYARGDILIQATDIGRWAAVLQRGRVNVLAVDRSRTIAQRWAGDIIGEQALLNDGERSASVQADTQVHALIIGGSDFDALLTHSPRILRVLCTVVSERLRESDRNLVGQQADAFTRVAQMLLSQAEEHSRVGGQGARISIGSQEAFGDLLGVSRESVVRALKRLRDSGIISTNRGVVTIHRPDELRAITVP